jgi:N-dimethylarginine dimethylaminohydrolase
MKILVSKLPKNPWWGFGTPSYENNPAMKEGVVPNQTIAQMEIANFHKTLLSLPVSVDIIEFPHSLDGNTKETQKHDFVFLRDLFISNQNGDIVISNFRETERQIEAEIMGDFLSNLDVKIHRLPQKSTCFAEGGEFYFAPNESILFSGLSRNSLYGVEKTSESLNVKEMVLIESKSFHLDTIFTPLLDADSNLCGLIVCLDLITKQSANNLKNIALKLNIPLIEINPSDAIGLNNKLGKFSVNCLPIPGQLIGPAPFSTQGAMQHITNLGIQHHIVELSQFRLSGGAVHCLTNEL